MKSYTSSTSAVLLLLTYSTDVRTASVAISRVSAFTRSYFFFISSASAFLFRVLLTFFCFSVYYSRLFLSIVFDSFSLSFSTFFDSVPLFSHSFIPCFACLSVTIRAHTRSPSRCILSTKNRGRIETPAVFIYRIKKIPFYLF